MFFGYKTKAFMSINRITPNSLQPFSGFKEKEKYSHIISRVGQDIEFSIQSYLKYTGYTFGFKPDFLSDVFFLNG